ncbi:NYN domain-containing protein [Rhizobium beringeri]
MTEWRRGCTLALIIDGDNATPKIVKRLLGEIANYKTTSVKCVYGDWTGAKPQGVEGMPPRHSIQPVQQFAFTTGKNATQ